MIKDNAVFHTAKGVMGAMMTNEIRIENMIAAENKVGVLFKPGTQDDFDNPMFAKGWLVTALARPDCPDCYSTSLGDMCKN